MEHQDESFNLLLRIRDAVYHDDCNSVSKIFEEHPDYRIGPISDDSETSLMFAVGTNRSHRVVKSLVSDLSKDGLIDQALAAQNDHGDTALHYAATVRNVIDFKLLVSSSSKPVELAFCKNKSGRTPLYIASYQGKKNEMLEFFFSRIGVLNPPVSGIPKESLRCGDLLGPAIEGEFIDIALKLVSEYSDIILRGRLNIQRPLEKLATNPKFFRSGSRLGFFGRLIYSLLPVQEIKIEPVHEIKIGPDDEQTVHEIRIGPDHEKTTSRHEEESIYTTAKEINHRKCTSEACFKRILRYIASPIMNIYDMKVTHRQASQLVRILCSCVIAKHNKHSTKIVFGSAMATAVQFETLEVIEEIIRVSPSMTDPALRAKDTFLEAIRRRQDRIYNLFYQITSFKMLIATQFDTATNESVLHTVAKSVPPYRFISHTGGAALQMQHELKWFKEIEANLVDPSLKADINTDQKTARRLFIDMHDDLLKEGQKWMKDTASSSTLVAALIVTMAFAAAFTAPGGNKSEGKNEGKPVYLDSGAFMLFIISDAVALFSSVTSVLMFLGILTSRYGEEDFLYTLPARMTVGLIFLFLSLAAMIVAFSATLAILLKDKVRWIAAPLITIACIPMGVFCVLQFPLLMRLIKSTFGPSIFHKQNKRMLH